jgi:hypothetical protein
MSVSDAIRNNFQRRDVRQVEPQLPSKAEAYGIGPPALSQEQRAGAAAEGALAASRFQAKAATHENYLREKAEYEKARDDLIWKRVQARRSAAV